MICVKLYLSIKLHTEFLDMRQNMSFSSILTLEKVEIEHIIFFSYSDITGGIQ
jgi:hypothetical protein